VSDEREGSGAAADGSDAEDTGERGGRTALAAEPATRPQRPAGKRSRQHTTDADSGDGASPAAAEVSEDDAGAKKAKKPKNAKKSADPSANPVVYVYNYLKQVVAELRKVIWPNRKQMITYTSVVLAFLVFMVALIGGADVGFAKLVMLVFGE
jgi:preprotein translocase subunit SecE